MDKSNFKMMVDGEYRSTRMTILDNGFRTNGYFKMTTKNDGVTYYLHPEDMSAVACVTSSGIVLPEKVRGLKFGSIYMDPDDEALGEEFVVRQLYVLGAINSELEIPVTVEDVYVDRLPFLRDDGEWVANRHQDLRFCVFSDASAPLRATSEGSLYTQGQERLLFLQTGDCTERSVVRLPDALTEIDDFAIMNLRCKELHVPAGVTRFPLSKSFDGTIYFDNKVECVEIFCPESGHDYSAQEKQMCPMLRFKAPELEVASLSRVRGHFLTLTKAPQPGDQQWCWAAEVKVNANHVEAIMPWLLDCTDERLGTRILTAHYEIVVYESVEQVSCLLASHDRR